VLKVPYEELMRVAGYLEPNTSTPADKEPALDDEQIKEIKEKFPNLFTLLARAKGPIPEILADQITDIAKTLLKEYLENEGKKDPEKGK
jgi:hypothetical protein